MAADFVDPLPIWGVFLLFAIIALLFYEGGFRLGRWWQGRTPEEKEGPTGMIVGSILALMAFLLAITMGMAEEGLADIVRSSTRVVGLADIEKAVCKTFELGPSTLQSDCRSRGVSYPRMLAMWLARKYTRSALSEIGQHFGRRSHATVISAQKRVDSWRSADSTTPSFTTSVGTSHA